MKLSATDKEKIRKLFEDWEEARASQEEAEISADKAFDELIRMGIDPHDPPKWLTK